MPILASPLKPNNPKLLSEIASVLVRLDHIASRIVNANHGIV